MVHQEFKYFFFLKFFFILFSDSPAATTALSSLIMTPHAPLVVNSTPNTPHTTAAPMTTTGSDTPNVLPGKANKMLFLSCSFLLLAYQRQKSRLFFFFILLFRKLKIYEPFYSLVVKKKVQDQNTCILEIGRKTRLKSPYATHTNYHISLLIRCCNMVDAP